MSEVLQFEHYHQKWRPAPPLVFVDMVQSQLEREDDFGREEIDPVLANCRLLLEEARERHWQVAFVRNAPVPGAKLTSASRWIEGFEPKRADMIFDRTGPSCYSSEAFADAMDSAGRVYVMAGFGADRACLATLMDAARNDHFVGLVRDASATRPLPGYDAAESHRAVLAVSTRYATIVTAEHWIGVAGGRPASETPKRPGARKQV